MKVLRKCEQGVYEDMLFNSLEELRDYLRELHSYTANSEEDEESINKMSSTVRHHCTLDEVVKVSD